MQVRNSTDYANYREYFRYGLNIGILRSSDVTDWALGIIEDLDRPPIEIIEVGMSRNLRELSEQLDELGKNAISDTDLVASWLFWVLKSRLTGAPSTYECIVEQARKVARETNRAEHIYSRICYIDYEVSLLLDGYGAEDFTDGDKTGGSWVFDPTFQTPSESQIVQTLEHFLAEYSTPLPALLDRTTSDRSSNQSAS
jgi:hypothetical protein